MHEMAILETLIFKNFRWGMPPDHTLAPSALVQLQTHNFMTSIWGSQSWGLFAN